MVAERLTVADLTTGLTEVLERVSHGERFMIERDGEVIATLVSPDLGPGITWGEFIATYHERPRPDKRFADDLEAILAEREILSDPLNGPTNRYNCPHRSGAAGADSQSASGADSRRVHRSV
jgi:antitoxin (DNA-binding transcriptional repressor) of toxin-antitoxin stability system